jgi:hypothetical protein
MPSSSKTRNLPVQTSSSFSNQPVSELSSNPSGNKSLANKPSESSTNTGKTKKNRIRQKQVSFKQETTSAQPEESI